MRSQRREPRNLEESSEKFEEVMAHFPYPMEEYARSTFGTSPPCLVVNANTELEIQISALKEQVQSMCNGMMSRNFPTFEEQAHMMYPQNQWPQNSFESCDYNDQHEESHVEEVLITFIQVS